MDAARRTTRLLFALSIGAGLMLLCDMALTHRARLGFLPWNLMLAWIPYGLSAWILSLSRRVRPGMGLLVIPTCVWLLFLPNAPYVVTDVVHIHSLDSVRAWIDAAFVALYAGLALTLGVSSLRTMQGIVRSRLGPEAGWTFVTVVIFLTALGVWIGRSLRWNSWDVVRDPIGIVRTTVDALTGRESAPLALLFILAFSAGLYAIYRGTSKRAAAFEREPSDSGS